jgi:hypothetical protein
LTLWMTVSLVRVFMIEALTWRNHFDITHGTVSMTKVMQLDFLAVFILVNLVNLPGALRRHWRSRWNATTLLLAFEFPPSWIPMLLDFKVINLVKRIFQGLVPLLACYAVSRSGGQGMSGKVIIPNVVSEWEADRPLWTTATYAYCLSPLHPGQSVS